ncbi:Guanylate cyclase 32E,Guanylate cyclase soluble subunit beta-2,Head-specific guanylate cyclase,Retinal guanylyl cyclase 2,Heat-stable enterotoxin receptor,Olfactory guanylyl cyclase GC-D,Atrial natriuretic peptide receptor 2,Receptor-type guanylate cyclase gcy-9,Receptor-type guanylate cyclase Gyc76C,Receptor-type guanylate cyclase gcy-27,Receptor-type guanylate cyclase gcy-18,Receptor-type guanylate cyclase gcy-28,Speract receptor,Receptor-type guanylate cyclase gcy-29,Receptor-type guanylate cyclase gcy-|uniref:guanylate cyclase n=1 Tax=Mytilus coruscus TaxID=42192 RepID=A0A6J8BEM3_MYTCO|nr:Guanylate cyclase 32E,Guanylate cyclase soluble subunit beta-2,Head-specific guanylate cyclase,Retinal guanylyl cyclase 2,Heat-stable enterotoxin receptor,Olfactory guanylyl cyclase GC-D,Atrial natriuretic peptide receptor 2,Receptor-type guanylate cyclase gcy-9,Receptor-type guanylate cyclase Gyc76C,Receptor-type guanylate cyclase gcy-27,Receptor-type guanylate cyclase gcy-18,Receptor-type guanylate cyclase gcy-28,Speract receptor,Receptor-type guanylate cyclase gcy-29,Receptor-type guanylate c
MDQTDLFVPIKRCCTCNENLSTKRGQNIILVKILVLAIIPIIVLVIQGGITIADDNNHVRIQNKVEADIKFSVEIGLLVHNLQIERGTTTMYVSSGRMDILPVLQSKRKITDKSLNALGEWISLSTPGYFRSKNTYFQRLREYRNTFDSLNKSSSEVIRFYSNDTDVILAWLGSVITNAKYVTGTRWQPLIAYHMILLSKEQAGMERALGGVFYEKGSVSSSELLWYKEKATLGVSYLARSMEYSNTVQKQINSRYTSSELEAVINSMRTVILANNSTHGSAETSIAWPNNITSYIDLLKEIQDILSQEIIGMLEDYVTSLKKNLIINVLKMVFVILLFPIIVFLVYTLTNKLQQFANSLKNKTYDLEEERRRSEQLLYQLLPISIARRMMKKKQIIPRHYDSVSIYFSDIAGFTDICSKSTPMQVIYMLNLLYIMMDDKLEAFDVYKVETIGDAYMVASGLPVATKNRTRHAKEVASMSLEIMSTVSEATVPHIPQERWKVRIGINTGPVVAGVVGTKMPRYCLFGDTVNVASRMESSGKPGMIQISSATKEALEEYPEFLIRERGDMTIKVRERDDMTIKVSNHIVVGKGPDEDLLVDRTQ